MSGLVRAGPNCQCISVWNMRWMKSKQQESLIKQRSTAYARCATVFIKASEACRTILEFIWCNQATWRNEPTMPKV